MSEPQQLFGVSRSLTGRFWSLAGLDEGELQRYRLTSGLPDLVCRLLMLRGVPPDSCGS